MLANFFSTIGQFSNQLVTFIFGTVTTLIVVTQSLTGNPSITKKNDFDQIDLKKIKYVEASNSSQIGSINFNLDSIFTENILVQKDATLENNLIVNKKVSIGKSIGPYALDVTET